ncbi:glycosyltransferase family 2 protein [Streptomyces sp. NPDC005017]|uniref:glycosyltransferase family 2 protein n=1 Tax=Streptomyces sp. NPDC005017 TaxID=3364706 RepID=UPI0036BE3346
MIKVSVVVPVYNAGAYIERCAPSLLGQSLGPESYEIVYVDDGSTDDSLQRLERLAARHRHVRILSQENSGWPGRPRNVGVRAARGEYVQFVDQDDELTPEALERLHRLGARNGSDIVLGKVTGTMQGPSRVFRRTVERCTAADAPLFESLTPHKMFRRGFLLDHGIQFPEGRVRLEDQIFMARAYVRAKTVSILGDYPCYIWNRRADGGNTSGSATTPEAYYGHLREVIDAVKEATEPGPEQDDLLRRSFRVELLRPVVEPRVLQRKGKDLERYFGVVRRMALECFPPGVPEGLPAVSALRARLLIEGRLDSLVELARRTRHIRPLLTVSDVHWESGRLSLTTDLRMLRPDGEPLNLHEHRGRFLLDPDLLAGIEGAKEWKVSDPFTAAFGDVLVHDTARDLWWFDDTELTPGLEGLSGNTHTVVLRATTRLDPLTLAGGNPLPTGTHQVWLYGQLLGVGRRIRFPASHMSLWGRSLGTQPRLVALTRTIRESQLTLAVGRPGRTALPDRLLLRATTDPRLRGAVQDLSRRVPARLRPLFRKADPWARGRSTQHD